MGQIGVRVPRLIELVAADETYAGLGQSSGQEKRLTDLRASVAFAHPVRLPAQVDGVRGWPGW